MRRAIAAIAMLLALTGCASQVAALAPVGGDTLTGVRTASIDKLLEKGVGILQAPTCTAVEKGYACQGTTVDGKKITVTATEDDDPLIIIVVGGGEPLFRGTMQSVLDAAAQATR